MRPAANYVLSIAGFDPSGGAGILADVKTFEANGVYGLGVCSALTFQNDVEFENVEWISEEKIISQIKILHKRFDFQFVKIGLIENLDVLQTVIEYCKLNIANCQLIWDPILKASAGFIFHKNIQREKLESICKQLFLITPNREEIKIFFPGKSEIDGAKYLSRFCNVLLKGGHNKNDNVDDILFYEDKQVVIKGERLPNEKHGSGCVLSSAITANLAKGKNLEDSCRDAKRYVEKYLKSNDGLLGFHNEELIATNFTN